MKRLKGIFRFILRATGVGIGLLGLTLALIQTPPGRRLLARGISSLSRSPDGSGVIVKDISGIVPFSFLIGEFGIRDQAGTWLRLENVRVRMAAGELIRGRLHARQVAVEIARLDRLPKGSGEEDGENGGGFSPGRDLPSFLVDDLLIRHAAVGDPVLGRAVTFRLSGTGLENDSGQGAQAELELNLGRGASRNLRLTGRCGPDLTPLKIDLRLSDEKGWLANRLLPGKCRMPFSLRVQGDGPLEEWRVKLGGLVPGQASLAGDLILNLARAEARGTIRGELLGLPSAKVGARGTVIANLSVPDNRQNLELNIQVRELTCPWGTARKIELACSILDVFGETSAGGEFEAVDLAFPAGEMGPGRIGRLRARLELGKARGQTTAELKMTGSDCRLLQGPLKADDSLNLSFRARMRDGELGALFSAGRGQTLLVRARGQTRMEFAPTSGTPTWPEQAPLAGRLELRSDLGCLEETLAGCGQKLSGRVRGDLFLEGSRHQPLLSGRIALMDGDYRNLSSGTKLHDVFFHARADGNRISLDRAFGQTAGGGRIELGGSLDVSPQGGFPYSFLLELSRARVIETEDFDAEISGQLRLEGNRKRGSLCGNLHIDQARGHIPDTLPASVPEIEVIEINKPGAQRREKPEGGKNRLSDIALDVRVAARKGIVIKGRGLDSEWGGDIRVTGSAVHPRVRGGLILREGVFVFMGEELQLKDCSIMLDGRYPPRPQLKINAELNTTDITIYLQILGPLDSPQVILSSQPPFPQDEILSRLLYGRPAGELTGIQALQIANGLRVLQGQGGFFDLLTGWTSLLGDIQIDLTELEGDSDKTAIRVRWSLNRNVYIENQQALDGVGNVLITRWNLGNNLELRARSGFGIMGDAAYLHWSWDY